jgi:tetratricopeptide (TPR) repeat protein
MVHLAAGRIDEAETAFREAAVLAPGFVDPHCNLAELAGQARRFDDAVRHARDAVAIGPSRMEAQLALGRALTRARRFDEALVPLEAAQRLAPGSTEALIGLGTALSRAGRIDAAIERVEAVRPSLPESYELLVHLGDLRLTRGETGAALAWFRRAAALRPADAAAQVGQAMALALQGDLGTAFAHFEGRCAGWPETAFRACPARRWQGEDIAGRTILLYAEQGFGDTVQFARFVPLVAACGARVVLEVQPALKSLLAGLEGAAETVGTDDPLPEHEIQCPLMSLPHVLGTTLGTIPAAIPYLHAAPEAASAWERRLAPLDRARIGVVWAGHPHHTHDAYRSIPLAALLPLFETGDAHFVSLQKEKRPGDAGLLAGRPEILDLGPRLGDFADTAALISRLDLVIAVDTAVAHIAGALGVPTWLLLQAAPDWRWLEVGAQSPWYPAMRLFRQKRFGDWNGVVTTLCHAFAETEWARGGTTRATSGVG